MISYIVGDGGPAIFRFSADGKTFLDTVTTTGPARSLAYGPDGTLYYTSSGITGGLYRVVDRTTSVPLFIASAFGSGGSGADLDVAPNGEFAYIVGDGGRSIFRFAADGTFLNDVTTTGTVRSVAYGPDGTLYYTSSGITGGLYRVVDRTTSVPLYMAPAFGTAEDGAGLDVAPNGEFAYIVGDGGNAIFRFAPDGDFLNAITTTGPVRSLAYGGDGALYYTSSGITGGLYRVIDRHTSEVLFMAPAFGTAEGGASLDVDLPVAAVPEPSSLALVALGTLCLGCVAYRRRRG
jgi:WD40 repeat protein